MSRKLLVLTVFLFFSQLTITQTSISPLVGIDALKLLPHLEPKEGFRYQLIDENSQINYPTMGLKINQQLTEKLDLSMSFFFSKKEYDFFVQVDLPTHALSTNYLNQGITFNIKVLEHLSIGTGVSVVSLFNLIVLSSYQDKKLDNIYRNNHELGVTLVATYEYKRLFVSVSYYRGLLEINPNNPILLSRNLGLHLGYTIPLFDKIKINFKKKEHCPKF